MQRGASHLPDEGDERLLGVKLDLRLLTVLAEGCHGGEVAIIDRRKRVSGWGRSKRELLRAEATARVLRLLQSVRHEGLRRTLQVGKPR